ncbi:GatB/YqeY domain-containing protein [Candidatus Omnitrophota bacterium]
MLEEKIYNDYKQALKGRQKQRSEFLSFLRADLKNQAIELKVATLEDNDVISVFKKQKKRLLDAKEQIEKSQRPDLLDQVKAELVIIDEYLPAALPREEVEKVIAEVIAETQASSMKDMGKVMKLSLEKLAGRADSKEVSQITKEKLS